MLEVSKADRAAIAMTIRPERDPVFWITANRTKVFGRRFVPFSHFDCLIEAIEKACSYDVMKTVSKRKQYKTKRSRSGSDRNRLRSPKLAGCFISMFREINRVKFLTPNR